MTEQDFQSAVLDLAHVYGWKRAHFRAARTEHGGWRTPVEGDGAGFPDLLLLRDDRLIVAELKSETGKATAVQTMWLTAFAQAGAEVHLWRPSQLQTEVLETLK